MGLRQRLAYPGGVQVATLGDVVCGLHGVDALGVAWSWHRDLTGNGSVKFLFCGVLCSLCTHGYCANSYK
jgi:hypothetical protein